MVGYKSDILFLPDAQIGYLYGGWLTMGQVLSLPILLGGVGLVIYATTRPVNQLRP